MNAIQIGLILAAAVPAGLACALQPRPGRNRERVRLADRIDALLPQTQCGQCGYPGCRPYAEAIAHGRVDINRCPPGGEPTITQLAELLGVVPRALDPALEPETGSRIAHIDEANCIGCVKCVHACPVDAILGAAGRMHAVIPPLCTGCGLCVAPCPVDCIDMRSPAATPQPRPWPKPGPAYGRAA